MSQFPRYDLVIFDCDGTLVDSEELNNSASAEILAEAGLPQYDTAYCMEHFTGSTIRNIFSVLKQRHPGIVFPENAVEISRIKVMEKIATALKPIPGAFETVQAIAQTPYRSCVASNGIRDIVLESLRLTQLDRFLPQEFTFTANMVANPKPAPDLFLLSAEKMATPPARCIVIEDSVFGVQAGRAAGMDVIGVLNAHHAHDPERQSAALREAGAMAVVPSLPEILPLLGIGAVQIG